VADFAHEQVCRVRDLVGEPAALGGAVTMALCGHWEHEGDCRWPHHTSAGPDGAEHVVTVRFDSSEQDVARVRRHIRDGLAVGHLTGPDGTTSTWALLD
jgi:hypothetical protein